MRTEVLQALIDQNRLDKITEIGLIDGGEWADVLAVTYEPGDTTIRIRYEQSGNRVECGLADGKTLEETLHIIADKMLAALQYLNMPGKKPVVTIFRGRQARKWVKRLVAQAERVASEAEAAGLRPENSSLPMVRMVMDMPNEPHHLWN